MNGTEFIAATAGILFVAFLAGWFTHWLVSRITRVTRNDMDDLDRMAQELHKAEEERDQTVTYFQSREADLSNKLTQTKPNSTRRWTAYGRHVTRQRNFALISNSRIRPVSAHHLCEAP